MEETTPRSVFPRAGLGSGQSGWSLKQTRWEPLWGPSWLEEQRLSSNQLQRARLAQLPHFADEETEVQREGVIWPHISLELLVAGRGPQPVGGGCGCVWGDLPWQPRNPQPCQPGGLAHPPGSSGLVEGNFHKTDLIFK